MTGQEHTEVMNEVCPVHGIPDCSPLLNACGWRYTRRALKDGILRARKEGRLDEADALWDQLDALIKREQVAAQHRMPPHLRAVGR